MSKKTEPGKAPCREDLNTAFWELGFRFQWDEATWAALSGMASLQEQMKSYLEKSHPHLAAMYDPLALAKMVEERLARPGGGRIGIEAHASF